jgi:signal transduction histidine kinase
MVFDELYQREKIARKICAELNNFTDLRYCLSYVVTYLKGISGCTNIGVRLEDNGEYPFYVFDGYSNLITIKKNLLCPFDNDSGKIRWNNYFLLDNICAEIVHGQTDPCNANFTINGSFWTNNISRYFAEIMKSDNDSIYREYNMTFSYESVAIIPIKARGIIVGLLQLSEYEENYFDLDMIRFIEMIGENIGLAVQNSKLFTNAVNELKLKEHLEKQTLEIKEAAAFERLKTNFLAQMSHELRTPLNSIISSLKLLETYTRKGDTNFNVDKLTKQYTIINQNSLRMLRLINNLLDISKIDSGELKMNVKNVDIVSLMKDIVSSVSQYASGMGIGLVFTCDVKEKYLPCDSDLIERMALNILSNALKFSASGDKITVDIRSNDEQIEMSFKDTGAGIPIGKISSVFEKFVQADKTFTRQSEGSGLGLTIVKSIVEMHGGTISLSSIVESGSEFIIQIPIKAPHYSLYARKSSDKNGRKICDKVNTELSDIYNDTY